VDRNIVWTDSAWQELESAASFIERDSARYARALVEEAKFVAISLRTFSKRGRVVPEVNDSDVREVFVKSYRLIYEIRGDRVVVIAFLHGARRFPTDL
jgi:toxin ParE1/3/4